MLIRERTRLGLRGLLTRVYRSKGGLWFPGMGIVIPHKDNVLALLRGPHGLRLIPGCNLVTDAGDIYYAQQGAGEATTNAFGIHELASVTPTQAKGDNRSAYTVIGSTQKAHTSTYPKTNDGDADNTGAGTDVVTYQASYAKGDFTAASIVGGIITNATPGASEPILTGYDFAATFGKTADDTLKVIVNHTMNGV